MAREAPLTLLQKELGYSFSDPDILLRAVTHISYARGKAGGHNETLEFLGDAVLDLAVSDLLMRRFPDKSEGDLSKMRAALVNATALAEKAARLGLGGLLVMGKGEERSGGRTKRSILAGAFEAVVGAVFWDGGYEPALRVIEKYFGNEIREKKLGQEDYKTRLQEISQMLFHEPPVYKLVAEMGPDHEKRFVTEIIVGGKLVARGEGRSKKQSEQEAAGKALANLRAP
ncbi:MAG TPA: ribonuclease III [Candidatus Binatia bacterium]|nr:ribonuclease III [Candidatus Binatia bacterium]